MIAGSLFEPAPHRPLDAGIQSYRGKPFTVEPREVHKPTITARDEALYSLHYFDKPVQYLEPDARSMMYRDKANESFQDYITDLANENLRQKVEYLQRQGYSNDEIRKVIEKKREADVWNAYHKPTDATALMEAQLAENLNVNAALSGRDYANEPATTPQSTPRRQIFSTPLIPITPQAPVAGIPATPARPTTTHAKSSTQMNKTELLMAIRQFGDSAVPEGVGRMTVKQLRTLLNNLKSSK